MSDDVHIKATVTGVKETIDIFWRRKAAVWGSLLSTMEHSGAELEAGMLSLAQSKMTRRTGNLFDSVFHKVSEKDDQVTVKAGAKAPHAKFMEKGVNRLGVTVRPTRRTNVGTEYGRVKYGKRRARFGVFAQGITFNKPFKRNFIIKPRPFVIPTYEGLRARIEANIAAAVGKEQADV